MESTPFFAGGGNVVFLENVAWALAVLLVLLLARVWIYYQSQQKAIVLAAVRIRKAFSARLSGGRIPCPDFRLCLGRDLQMVFDLTRWRFRDFYPELAGEGE